MRSHCQSTLPHASDSPGNPISKTKEKHPPKGRGKGDVLRHAPPGSPEPPERRRAPLPSALWSRAAEPAARGSRLTAARLRPAGRLSAKDARHPRGRRPRHLSSSPRTLPPAAASRSPLSPRALPPLRRPPSAPSRCPSAHRQPTAQRRLPPGDTRGEAAISRRRRGRCCRARPSVGAVFLGGTAGRR